MSAVLSYCGFLLGICNAGMLMIYLVCRNETTQKSQLPVNLDLTSATRPFHSTPPSPRNKGPASSMIASPVQRLQPFPVSWLWKGSGLSVRKNFNVPCDTRVRVPELCRANACTLRDLDNVSIYWERAERFRFDISYIGRKVTIRYRIHEKYLLSSRKNAIMNDPIS